MAFRLAHLSDVHLGPLPRVRPHQLMGKRVFGYLKWRQGRHLLHRPETLDALVKDLREQAPDHVIVSGDLVNIALPLEFMLAGAWLRQLGDPAWVTVVPGNHDAYVRVAWAKAWAYWRDYMAGDGAPTPEDPRAAFPFLRRRGDLAIIGLSTAVASAPTFATGRLGRRQRAKLDALLASLAGSGLCRIIVLHHPPVPGLTGFRRRLVDADRLAELLARHGAELVLCGHEHVLKEGALPGPAGPIPVIVAPSASLGAEPAGRGGYLLHTIARKAGGWATSLELRAFSHGAFTTVRAGAAADARAAPPA